MSVNSTHVDRVQTRNRDHDTNKAQRWAGLGQRCLLECGSIVAQEEHKLKLRPPEFDRCGRSPDLYGEGDNPATK